LEGYIAQYLKNGQF
jgi:hypothetical protein